MTKLVGESQYCVYLATKHDRKYAAKFLHNKTLDQIKDNELFLFHHGEGHPNLLEVENFCEGKPMGSWIFTEYCKYGDLASFSQKRPTKFKKQEVQLEIMKQIAAGVEFLHSQNKVHRDLKPGNILIAKKVESGIIVKVSDFGEGRTLDRTTTATVAGTPYFAAPELFGKNKSRQNSKIDTFSLGLTFLGIIQQSPKLIPVGNRLRHTDWIGNHLLKEPNYQAVQIKNHDDAFTRGIKEIILKTVTADPENRMSATEILHALELIEFVPSAEVMQSGGIMAGQGEVGGCSTNSEIPDMKYEYLDHPADVQLHAWGDDLKEAFEQVGMAMFGYMTEIDKVEMKEIREVEAEGDDMMGLLFHFLDELLFLMCDDPYFIVRKVQILEFDKEQFKIKCRFMMNMTNMKFLLL